MELRRNWVGAVIGLLLGTPISAPAIAGEPRGFVGINAGVFDVDLNEQSYFPRQVHLNAGVWLREGIAAEVHWGADAGEDTNDGLAISANSYQGVYLRWQSPQLRLARAHILSGYSWLELEGSIDDTDFPGRERFSGPALGVGLSLALTPTSPWSIGLAYTHHFLEDDMKTESIHAAIQYDF